MEVPPPGTGFDTAIEAVPASRVSAAAMEPRSCVALTKVVGRSKPFQSTLEPDMNPVPLIVRVRAPPATVAEAGVMLEIVGTGLSAWRIENGAEFETPPSASGFATATVAEPATAISLARMEAVSRALLANAVVRSEPFQRTLEKGTNPLPLIANTKAPPPAVADGGLRPRILGEGFSTLNGTGFEGPPPGAGLTTTMVSEPGAATSAEEIGTTSCVSLT